MSLDMWKLYNFAKRSPFRLFILYFNCYVRPILMRFTLPILYIMIRGRKIRRRLIRGDVTNWVRSVMKNIWLK